MSQRLVQPVGCFALNVAGDWILIDAGVGPHGMVSQYATFETGYLPRALAAAGLAPSAFRQVLCTHLHPDHMGWTVADRRPYFENAVVRFGAGDWDQFVRDGQGPDSVREAMTLLEEAGRIDLIDGDGVVIAPGLTSRATPGHSWGHTAYVLSAPGSRAMFLGDSVLCPAQLEGADWALANDVDPDLARRTRRALQQELDGSGIHAVGAHFPGLRAGQVLMNGEHRRFI